MFFKLTKSELLWLVSIRPISLAVDRFFYSCYSVFAKARHRTARHVRQNVGPAVILATKSLIANSIFGIKTVRCVDQFDLVNRRSRKNYMYVQKSSAYLFNFN